MSRVVLPHCLKHLLQAQQLILDFEFFIPHFLNFAVIMAELLLEMLVQVKIWWLQSLPYQTNKFATDDAVDFKCLPKHIPHLAEVQIDLFKVEVVGYYDLAELSCELLTRLFNFTKDIFPELIHSAVKVHSDPWYFLL